MSARLAGQVALVTGASRGIGRAIALELAEEGADLALLSTSVEGTRDLAAALVSQGRRALSVAADVGEAAAVERALQRVTTELGEVDLLVNNAAIIQRRPLEQTSDADFDSVLRVNLAGPFYLCRRVLPRMAERGRGRIVNISSISGTLGSVGQSSYNASKWGLDGLTKSLAAEYKDRGILVAAVLPGGVATDMLKGSAYPAVVTPQEVARMVRFLCTEAPLAMSGALVEAFG